MVQEWAFPQENEEEVEMGSPGCGDSGAHHQRHRGLWVVWVSPEGTLARTTLLFSVRGPWAPPKLSPGSQLQGLPLTPPVVVTHGVQIVHSSGELFQEYRYGDVRSYHGPAQLTHTQFPATASIGLPSRTKVPTQVSTPSLSSGPES